MNLSKTVDTRDGREVAAIVSSFYLNSSWNQNRFNETFAMYKRPGHNFIVLILQWFYELGRTEYFDGRNEQSVLLAKDLSHRLNLNEEFDFFCLLRHTEKMVHPKITVDNVHDDACIAYLLSCHLSDSNTEHGVFTAYIAYMLREHRTLQQSFTRFCRSWCQYVAEEKPFGANSKVAKLASEIAKDQRCLPLV